LQQWSNKFKKSPIFWVFEKQNDNLPLFIINN
jgi:hypothetical protein